MIPHYCYPSSPQTCCVCIRIEFVSLHRVKDWMARVCKCCETVSSMSPTGRSLLLLDQSAPVYKFATCRLGDVVRASGWLDGDGLVLSCRSVQILGRWESDHPGVRYLPKKLQPQPTTLRGMQYVWTPSSYQTAGVMYPRRLCVVWAKIKHDSSLLCMHSAVSGCSPGHTQQPVQIGITGQVQACTQG